MVKPPLRTKSIGFKVSEEEYARLETAARASGQTLGELWGLAQLFTTKFLLKGAPALSRSVRQAGVFSRIAIYGNRPQTVPFAALEFALPLK